MAWMAVYTRPLSHSSISLYLECPQKFKFRYIDKIPEAPKWFFSFGQSVHKALEFFYAVTAPPAPGLEQVLAFYKEHWKKEGYKNSEQESEYFTEGERILREFHHKHAEAFRVPLFTEYKFEMEVEGVKVTGIMDRVDKLDNGRLAVVDYKTGKAIAMERVERDPQLTMYQMAAESLLGMPVESLTFYHLPSLTPLTVAPHSPDRVSALRDTIVTVHDQIQSARFDPKPEERKCQWCDYRPHCPVFKHLYSPTAAPTLFPAPAGEPGAPSERAEAGTDLDKLAELVDRYGALMESAEAARGQAEEVKKDLLTLLHKNGYVRAFGSRYEVSSQMEFKWDIQDRNKVLEVLKRFGLYDRVLKPSAPEVYRLLDSPDLPPEARKEIETAGERKESAVLSHKRIQS